MIIYITFGQIHIHSVNGKTFDKDCIAAIECDSVEDGRSKAFEYFGDKFFTSYLTVDDRILSYFPRGIIKVNEHTEEKELKQ